MAGEQYFTGGVPKNIPVKCAAPSHSQPMQGRELLGFAVQKEFSRLVGGSAGSSSGKNARVLNRHFWKRTDQFGVSARVVHILLNLVTRRSDPTATLLKVWPWKLVWKVKISTKIASFSWLAIRESCSTRDNLAKRGIMLCSK